MRESSFSPFVLAIICTATALLINTVDAQVRQSSSYQLQSDSVNFGGGYSSSTNYQQESTAGEIATGENSSTNYNLYAGYQQMQEVYLALSSTGNVSMTPPLSGIGGGIANGSTTFTAVTDSASGYQMTMAMENDPAMQFGAYSIDDYTPSGANPDLHFSIAANEAEFAFSPYGDDIVTRYQNNGAGCNVSGTASRTACWDSPSTTDVTIAQNTSPNHPDGATTTVYFRVGIGGAAVKVPGDYVATSTVTLLAL